MSELERQRVRVIIEADVVFKDIPMASAPNNGRPTCPISVGLAAERDLAYQSQLLHQALQDPDTRTYLIVEALKLHIDDALQDWNLELDHVSDDENRLSPVLDRLPPEVREHFRRAFQRNGYRELDDFWAAQDVEFVSAALEVE